jgi:Flp pilus assembly protein TadD
MLAAVFLLAATPAADMAAPDAVSGEQLRYVTIAVDQGRYVQASAMIEKFRLAQANGPADPGLTLQAARMALVERRDAEALAGFDEALTVLPNDCTALEGAGIAAARLGELDRAALRLDVAAEKCARRWQVWNALGVVADQLHDFDRASTSYQRAEGLSPGNAAILNNQGYSQLLQKHFEAAADYFHKALQRSPQDERVSNNLDIALSASGQPLGAVAQQETSDRRALRLNNAGYGAMIAGDVPRARAYFVDAIATRGAFYQRASDNLGRTSDGHVSP